MDVKGTVANLRLLDYGLNLLSDTQIKSARCHWGKHVIQLLSYFSHPVDLGVQMIAYPLLRLANPFVTVGVNLRNDKWGQAIGNTLLIPAKLLWAIPKIGGYESGRAVKLAVSIVGLNTMINVLNGCYQTRNFFKARIEWEQRLRIRNHINQKKWHIGERKICRLVGLHQPVNYQITSEKPIAVLVREYEANRGSFLKVFDQLMEGF